MKRASGWMGPDLGRDQRREGFLTVTMVPGPPERGGNVTGANRGKVDVPGVRES